MFLIGVIMSKINRLKRCACGCGKIVNKRFVSGHNSKVNPPNPKVVRMIRLCQCDCGKFASPGRKFISGHNPVWNKGLTKETDERVKKYSENNSISHLGKSPANKGIKEVHHSIESEFKKDRIPWNKGIPMREKSKYWLGKKHDERTKIKNSLKHKELWQVPEYIIKQMKSRGVKPNKSEQYLEKFLDKLYPNEWKFVGDGQLIIAGKCPDFVNVNGQKKIIELYGDYWHKNDKPQDRKDIFFPFGYSTLIIWEHDLRNESILKCRLNKFMRS